MIMLNIVISRETKYSFPKTLVRGQSLTGSKPTYTDYKRFVGNELITLRLCSDM